MTLPNADVELRCPDLEEAQAYFCERLGFRLLSVFPADNPRQLLVQGQGACLRLVAQPASTSIDGDGAWVEGRAGMQYRDLLPDRHGGDFIVSHIRIPGAGPVPDYVHQHQVRFQMIYCHRGWVRVVYEGQGEPFDLKSGDCVLQPPGIRHRVLESGDDLEVLEISSPAEHPTLVEHELSLPSPDLDGQHTWDGQRFVHHRAADAKWRPSVWPGFETRDLGIGAATDNQVKVNVLRRTGQTAVEPWQHDRPFWLRIVLQGAITYEAPNHPAAPLQAGQAISVPPGAGVMFTAPSQDLQILEVVANYSADSGT